MNLGQINPALAPLGNYNFPVRAVGNEDLKEESTESFELAYTGVINNRATVSAAVYFTKNTDEIFFTQTGRYRALAPPPGWVAALPICRSTALGILEAAAAALPVRDRAVHHGVGLPSEFSYRNLGTKNKGFELGIDGAVNQALNVFANYSYQASPIPTSTSRKSTCRRRTASTSASTSARVGTWATSSVSFVDDAFFQDVLDARFAGPTESYTQINGAFGVTLGAEQGHDHHQGDQPDERGHPVARLRRHRQAPGDRRTAVPVLSGATSKMQHEGHEEHEEFQAFKS